MVKGLYTAYTGMLNEQHRMDTITNNLANVNTYGFKKEGAVSQAFDDVLGIKIKDTSEHNIPKRLGIMNMGVKIGENYTDYDQGPLKDTGSPFDVALSGNGFFAIEFTNKAGETTTKYTRDGNFTLTQEGTLVTMDGNYVLDDAGNHITVNPLAVDISINQAGQIFADGAAGQTIGVTDFTDYNYLAKYGENLYEAVEGAEVQPSNAIVIQNYLEASNVNVVHEMVDMIALQRNYEANQKVITTMDSSLEPAVNTLGKLS